MSLRKRVVGGVAGLAAVRIVQLVGPLLQLPVLIGRWGIDVFGGWVTASAIATLCTIAALSIYPAIQANVAMSRGRGELELAARYQFSGLVLCLAATILLLVLLVSGYGLLVTRGIYSVPDIDMTTVDLLFLANAMSGIAAYNSSVMGGVGRFGLGNAVEAARRALELVAMLILVGVGGAGPVWTAALLCVSAAGGIAVSGALLRRVSRPVLPPGRFDIAALWGIRNAMLGAFCLAYAYPQLFVVGPRILIGVSLNNAAVALFAVATNLVRVLRQVADVISYPFLNDLSYSYGEGRTDRVREIFILPSQLCFFMSLVGSAAIIVVGPWLIQILTKQSFEGERILLIVLSMSSVIECTSLVALTFLLGIGRTILSSLVLLVAGTLATAAAVPLSAKIGLVAFSLANLAGTIVYAAALWKIALPIMQLPWRDFFGKLMAPPIGELVAEARSLIARRKA